MDSLPNELLSYILYLGLPPMRAIGESEKPELMVVDKPGPVRAYLSKKGLVCKRWRDTVIHTPILWSMAYFGVLDIDGKKDALGVFRTFLHRSKGTPIHVEIDAQASWFGNEPMDSVLLEAMRCELTLHSSRVRSLVLKNPPRAMWPLGGTWSSLESVEVRNLADIPSFDIWPSLSSLIIHCVSVADFIALRHPNVFPLASCLNLKNLCWIGPYGFSGSRVMQAAPSLEYLAFERIHISDGALRTPVKVNVPHLKFRGVSSLLHLVLPIFSANVQHLYLIVTRVIDINLLPNMFPCLLSLEIRCRHNPLYPYRTPKHASILLEMAPQLRAYSTSGVMDAGHVHGVLERLTSPSLPLAGPLSGGANDNVPHLRLLRMVATCNRTFGLPIPPPANQATEVGAVTSHTLTLDILMRDILLHRPHLIVEIAASWRYPGSRDVFDVCSNVAKDFPGRLLLQDVEDIVTTADAPEYLINRAEAWSEL